MSAQTILSNLITSLTKVGVSFDSHPELSLIKSAFINGAKILYGTDNYDSPKVTLIGVIDGRYHKLGNMETIAILAQKENLIPELKGKDFYTVHRYVDSPYRGLGYGEDMLACITKFIQEQNGVTCIISYDGTTESRYAIKTIHSMIKNQSGFRLIPICILVSGDKVFALERKDVESVLEKKFKITREDEPEAFDSILYECNNVILSASVQKTYLKNKDLIQYSVGYAVINEGVRITIPAEPETEEILKELAGNKGPEINDQRYNREDRVLKMREELAGHEFRQLH